MKTLLTSERFGLAVMPRDSFPWSARVPASVFLPIAALVMIAPAQAQPRAYVSSGDSVVVIDTATNTLGAAIGLTNTGDWPAAASPDGAFVYVSGGGSPGVVSVIDAAMNAVGATVVVGDSPAGVALTPDGASAYVANQASGTVSVVNTATNTIDAMVGVGPMPSSIAIRPDGAFAYVANRGNATVSVIDTASNTVDATVTVSPGPLDLAITPDGSRVYVASQHMTGRMSVIDTATNAVDMVTIGAGQSSVAISPDGAFAYVSVPDFHSILAVDTATNLVVNGTMSPIQGCDIALTPDGASLYATRLDNSNVDVIETSTLSTVASVPGVGGCGITIADFSAAPSGIEATIDVKPDSINPKSNQKIQVTVFTTDTFDALQVDPSTALFGPEGASVFRVQAKDVDGDGDADAIFHFETRATGIACGDTEAAFVGETYAGEEVSGTDSIGTAPCSEVAAASGRRSASTAPRRGRGRGPRDDRV